MAYGLTTVDVRRLAFEVAVVNNVTIPESWSTSKMAGKDWLRAFIKRRKTLSIRKPEACSLARLTSFNRHNVQTFFTNLRNILEQNPSLSDGSRIFNLDETGTTTVQNPKKNNCIERCQASEPLRAPPGTLGLATPSGWMNSEIFIQVLDHFIKYSHSSKDNPSLLIYDNHESHISVQIVNKAREAGVKILTLPPHCSNRMQPLDVAVYGPFKAYFNAACDKWMLKSPGTPLIAECVAEAHCKAFTPANIISGFFKTGIMPFNPDIFTDADFIQSEVTNQPLNNHEVAGPSNTAEASNSNSPQLDPSYILQREVTPPRLISPEDIRELPKSNPRKQLRRARAKEQKNHLILDEAKEKPTKKKRKIAIEENLTSDEEETVEYKDSSSDWEHTLREMRLLY
ncbi:uncharacterized protein LOC116182078 [Photinus pyralis]|uniref:uncharacterized protein LOC116182078 n=1 Tax=Photinus pyralis TaxID=7054 RepID=UPI0012673821|nr:uncharacterized protein LOC116182078 [Photinus pyralis]